MLKSTLCDYSDAHILIKGNITIARRGAEASTTEGEERDKEVLIKNCARFTDCINEINNAQGDNAKDIDVAMSIYNFIEYSDNYLQTPGRLWLYYRDEANATLTDSESFRSKVKKNR